MIAKIQDHVILLIDPKYSARIGFVEQAVQLSHNEKDGEVLEHALTVHDQIFAIFRSGKLKAWYVCRINGHAYELDHFFVGANLSKQLQEKCEKEITKELLSQCIKGRCTGVHWRNTTVEVDRKPIHVSILLGFLFGAAMGFVFGWFTASLPVGIAIGVLWAFAMAYVFSLIEMRKQLDQL